MKTITLGSVRITWEGFDEEGAGVIRIDAPVKPSLFEEAFVEEVTRLTVEDEDGLYMQHGGLAAIPATSYDALHAIATAFVMRNASILSNASVAYFVPPVEPRPESPAPERTDILY